jgi:NADH-quinone oxidoreductase subunit D
MSAPTVENHLPGSHTSAQIPAPEGAGSPNYSVRRKLNTSGESEGELLEISMGPQHPSTHGVFRMDIVLDGEQVVKLKPVFGYLHRNHEKIGEGTTYLGSMPYTDRLDYFCSMTNNWAYVLAVEKLAGLQVPERAEYLRVILAELTRLQNHASLCGFLLQDMGAMGTPLMYAFRERENILDLFEAISGARMMCNFMRFGGCRCDAPAGWLERVQEVVNEFPHFLDEFEMLLNENEILMARTQGIAVLPRELVVNASITGPLLRSVRISCAAWRARRCLRSLHDARVGNARVAEDFAASPQVCPQRSGCGSEGEVARFSSESGRSVRTH